MLFCTGSHGGGQMAKRRRGVSWAYHVFTWTMTVRSAWRVVPWAGAVSAPCHKLRLLALGEYTNTIVDALIEERTSQRESETTDVLLALPKKDTEGCDMVVGSNNSDSDSRVANYCGGGSRVTATTDGDTTGPSCTAGPTTEK